MRTIIVPALLLLTACGPASVKGTIDGQRVGSAKEAIYDEVELDFGIFGEVNFLVVILTDVPDACEVYQDVFAGAWQSCEERCEDYVDVGDTYLRKDEYWSTTLTAHSNGSFEQEYDYDEDLGTDEFTLNFAWIDTTGMYDQDTCVEQCQDNELLDANEETGNDGVLEIQSEGGGEVKGRFDVDMGSGEWLQGSFTAEKCDTADWLFL